VTPLPVLGRDKRKCLQQCSWPMRELHCCMMRELLCASTLFCILTLADACLQQCSSRIGQRQYAKQCRGAQGLILRASPTPHCQLQDNFFN